MPLQGPHLFLFIFPISPPGDISCVSSSKKEKEDVIAGCILGVALICHAVKGQREALAACPMVLSTLLL